jgi:hypothetical protein
LRLRGFALCFLFHIAWTYLLKYGTLWSLDSNSTISYWCLSTLQTYSSRRIVRHHFQPLFTAIARFVVPKRSRGGGEMLRLLRSTLLEMTFRGQLTVACH